MTKFVYTSEARAPLYPLIAPNLILCDLLRKRELILACARREFHASYRETLLGAVWPLLNPLIMLAIFTLVFGYIFGGKFSQSADETPAEFALAMFVGLSFYLCVGNSLTSAPGLILGNTVYVKTFSFPLEVIAVSTVLNLLANMVIALCLCIAGFFAIHGFLYWTAIFLVPLIVCAQTHGAWTGMVPVGSWRVLPGSAVDHIPDQYSSDVHERRIFSDFLGAQGHSLGFRDQPGRGAGQSGPRLSTLLEKSPIRRLWRSSSLCRWPSASPGTGFS